MTAMKSSPTPGGGAAVAMPPQTTGMSGRKVLLEAQNLKKHFAVGRAGILGKPAGFVRAVDGVNFTIAAGQTIALAGESGCGKTTLGNVLLRLELPTEGTLLWEGKDIATLTKDERQGYRRSVQAVFQDPWSSLDGRMKVQDLVGEPLTINEKQMSRAQILERVAELLDQVGLQEVHMERFPHEFSGGQRQRIAVARALSLNPKVIILDEPVSALDVSIRAQVMNLLKDLQEKYNMAYFMVSHNLATARFISDTVAIMYLGRFAEYAESETFFKKPLHPYSQALVSASLPVEFENRRQRIVLQGEVPSPINPPSGCRFRTRCPQVMDICSEVQPELMEVVKGQRVACHLYK